MDSGNQHRTLTSEQTYNFGSNQEIVLSLSRSQRRILLSTDSEELDKGLQRVPTEAVLNYTEVFIGGLPNGVGDDLGVSGFSGCLWMSSLAELSPGYPNCPVAGERSTCSYCSQEVHAKSHTLN